MKSKKNLYLSLAAPFLVLLGIFGFFYRKDNDRVQSLPALVTGLGMMSSSFIRRKLRRKKLLEEIRQGENDLN